MSCSIDIGPYCLESDAQGWTTFERRVHEEGKHIGKEYVAHQRYHNTLTDALTSLQNRWVRESSCTSFDEVLAELKSFRAEVAGLFSLQVKEPDRNRHRRAS